MAHKFQPEWVSRLNFFWVACVIKVHSCVFGFCRGPQRRFLSRFLAFHRMVHVLVVVMHGFPPWFFDSPEYRLTVSVPIRFFLRELSTLGLSHSMCQSRCATHLPHVPAKCSSAPSLRTSPGAVNLGFTTLFPSASFPLSRLRGCLLK